MKVAPCPRGASVCSDVEDRPSDRRSPARSQGCPGKTYLHAKRVLVSYRTWQKSSWPGWSRGPAAHGLVPWASTSSDARKRRRGCADQVRARRLQIASCASWTCLGRRHNFPGQPCARPGKPHRATFAPAGITPARSLGSTSSVIFFCKGVRPTSSYGAALRSFLPRSKGLSRSIRTSSRRP